MQQPGWYPDPWVPDGTRWWDGQAWTEHVGGGPAAATPTAPNPTAPATPTQPTPAFDPYVAGPPAAAASAPAPAGGSGPGTGAKVAIGAGAAVVLLFLAVGVVALLGGGDDGDTEPPDLADVVVGSTPDEDAYCDDIDTLDSLGDASSPTAWAEAISRLAAHAHDDDTETLAAATVAWFRWNIEGQRSQELYDESVDGFGETPTELCDVDLTEGNGPTQAEEALQDQAEALAEQQGLEQPENRFFLVYGMTTLVFSDPTPDELLAACEAWGDQPYETLAEDGVLILGKSNDDIDVLEDPVVMRFGVDEQCQLLEPGP